MGQTSSEKKPLILVLGAGKSGTTALHFCLKASAERHFGVEFPQRFEPKTAADIDAFVEKFGVVKMLLERFDRTTHDFLPRFDKCILIFRDPRDNVISRLMHFAGTRLKNVDAATRDAILQKFLAKEREPESVSVRELFDYIAPLIGKTNGAAGARKIAFRAASFSPPAETPFFRLRYEHFVDGRVSDLRDYLGFEILVGAQASRKLEQVRRTKAHGYWRNWFTDEDYQFFVAERREELLQMGYDDLEPYRGKKSISPAEISEYLERQLNS